jgi:hypothetical protein
MLLGPLAGSNRWLQNNFELWYHHPLIDYFLFFLFVRNYYNYHYIWPIPLNFKEFFQMVGVVRQHDRGTSNKSVVLFLFYLSESGVGFVVCSW